MPTSTDLKLDWASHEAALFACKNWHYSKTIPVGKTLKIGVWEFDRFIGVVIFSYGANNNAPKSFELTQYECCELTRVALTRHKTAVSKILSIALKFLKKSNPGIKIVFSYADKTNQGHYGIIYQANGWDYLGERTTSSKDAYYIINGKKIHGRSARAKYGKSANFPKGWTHCPSETKHLYVKVIDSNYKLKHEIKRYPKRVEHESNAVSFHETEGGAVPTDTLHRSLNGTT